MEQDQSTIDKLFAVGAHFGYAPSRRHPSVAPYIFGAKGGTELFDLERTSECLEQALEFVKTLAAARKTILFIGSKAEGRAALTRAAQRLSQPYVASRWIGGTLTNFSEIKKRISRLLELSDLRERGELAKFTKHERLLIDREIVDLTAMFGGLRGMAKLPDALFVVDSKQESGSVEEARQLKIPVIALLNSDCNKTLVTYPIPANDASMQTIAHVLGEVAHTYESNIGAPPTAEPPTV
ncbi:MAG: 30S ribosomal protein S2 [bacterium]|nr:30S ribosomal protein S2 [bacterium]